MITLLTAMAATIAVPDPLAPARAGKFQCYRPDASAKACQGLEYYTPTGPSTYLNRSVVLVDLAGPVTVEVTSVVRIRGGAECSTIRAADALGGKVMVNGHQAPTQEARPVLSKIARAVAPLNGREYCVRYESTEDETLVGRVTIGGVRRPDLDEAVLWVDPNDGYSVGN